MKLTSFQMRSLLMAQQARHAGFSVRAILLASCKPYAIMFGVNLSAIALGWWAGVPEAAWVLIGMTLGAVLRDVRLLRMQARLWPMNADITDWKRVAELIAENSEPRAA